MKKSAFVLTIALSLFVSSGVVVARGGQQVGNQPESVVENRGIDTATTSLNRIIDRRNSDAVGGQVRIMVQNQEKVQVRTKMALQQMDQRNEAVKFMVGPDYKNVGQVRSDVVLLKNDIGKLERLKENVLPSDMGDVQGAIDDLQVETDGLEAQLIEELSGFSLFGWLTRLLSN